MEIVNYTGRPVGLSSEAGHPLRVINSIGTARCEVTKEKSRNVDGVIIYREGFSRVVGLPESDNDLAKRFIVSPEVAKAMGKIRFDLLIGQEPYTYEGQMFYKYLIAV